MDEPRGQLLATPLSPNSKMEASLSATRASLSTQRERRASARPSASRHTRCPLRLPAETSVRQIQFTVIPMQAMARMRCARAGRQRGNACAEPRRPRLFEQRLMRAQLAVFVTRSIGVVRHCVTVLANDGLGRSAVGIAIRRLAQRSVSRSMTTKACSWVSIRL